MEKDIFFLFLEIRIFFENEQMLSTVESIWGIINVGRIYNEIFEKNGVYCYVGGSSLTYALPGL